MRLVEATSTDTATSSSAAVSSSRTSTASGDEQFATVLSATRSRSRDVADSALSAGQGTGSTSRLERLKAAVSKNRAHRDQIREAESSDAKSSEPSQTDRLRESVQQKENTEPAADTQTTNEADAFAQTHDGGFGGESESPVSEYTQAGTAEGGTLAVSQSQQSAAASTTSSTATAGASSQASSTGGTRDGAVRAVQSGDSRNTSGASNTSGNVAATPEARSGNAGSGNSGDSSDASQEKVAVAAVRTTSSVSRTTNTNEFQQLLSQLGRQRLGESGPTSSQTPAAATKGKSAAAALQKTVDMESTGSIDELARLVRSQIGQRRSSMTIELSPQELGRVRVDVQMQDGVASIEFQADTPEGEQAIRSKLDDLRSALEQQGIRVDHVQVEQTPVGQSTSHPDTTGQTPADTQQWQMPANGGQGGGGSSDSRQMTGDGAGLAAVTEESDSAWSVPSLAADWQQTGVDVLV
jgi:flagellar hook-length control protein FliK